VISEALRGLGHAHDLPTGDDIRGVVHRDVSAHNVLLSWEGAVKVSDFGIAKAREATAATASTMIKGKPGYMSPEQANGEALDGRSDLFATGVMLWEILTGRRLFEGTTQETIAQVLFKTIPRPSSIQPGVPADLESITMRLLERERAQRYQNAEAVVDDLARCAVAPRNGRSDLARLLAERFPQETASRSSRPALPARPAAEETAETVQAWPAWPQSSTTLGNAVSQSVVGPDVPRRRRRVRLAVAAIVVASTAVVFAVARSRHETETRVASPSIDTPPSEMVGVVTLSIATVPKGAFIRVDGIARGPSPVKVTVTRGVRVAVDADLAGYQPASQTLDIASEEPSMSLALTALPASTVDVGAADAAVMTSAPPDARTSTRPPRKQPSAKSNAGTFNPNEVGGD